MALKVNHVVKVIFCVLKWINIKMENLPNWKKINFVSRKFCEYRPLKILLNLMEYLGSCSAGLSNQSKHLQPFSKFSKV